MSHHTLRPGAIAAIAGGLLTLAGNVLHPREPGQLESAANLFSVVAHSSTWVSVHTLLTFSLVVLLLGFRTLTRSISRERGAPWAGFGLSVATLGTVFGVALMLTEATAVVAAADRWALASGQEKELALSAGSAVFELSLTFSVGGMLLLFGLTPLLYGIAILVGRDYPAWLGWAGALFGSASVAGAIVQLLAGDPAPAFYVLFPVAAIGTTVWISWLGVLMLHRTQATNAD